MRWSNFLGVSFVLRLKASIASLCSNCASLVLNMNPLGSFHKIIVMMQKTGY